MMLFQKNIFSKLRLAEIYIGLLLCSVVLSMPSNYDGQPQRSYYPSKQYKKLFHSRADSTILKNFDAHQNCNVENAHLPTPDSLILKTVAVGRGTQNYTCLEGPEDKPVINGAVAILLDATCIASKDPSKLAALSKDALQLDLCNKTETITSSNLKISGRHFFRDAKTAIFDFSTLASDLGTATVRKQNSAPPPPDSAVGKDGEGFGAVQWLKLISADDDSKLREVYRIDTAGGSPPPTCVNMPKTFEIEYAAVYWFFGPRDKENCA